VEEALGEGASLGACGAAERNGVASLDRTTLPTRQEPSARAKSRTTSAVAAQAELGVSRGGFQEVTEPHVWPWGFRSLFGASAPLSEGPSPAFARRKRVETACVEGGRISAVRCP